MVLQKRQEYACSGYQVPAMLQVPKSAKGKRSIRKKAEENQMCAFDLLATLAGELLQEKENSPIPRSSCPSAPKETVIREKRSKEKQIKSEPYDQGSCIECSVLPILGGNNSEARIPGLVPTNFSTEAHSPGPAESFEGNIAHITKGGHGDLIYNNHSGRYALGDRMELDCKPPTIVSSDSSIETPISTERVACNDSFKSPDVKELVDGDDDDDNSSGCTHRSTITFKAARQQNVEDHRARKLMASKYWKAASTTPRDGELSNSEAKPVFRNRKMCFTRQMTQRSLFKRRKVFERCSIPASEGDDMDHISVSLGKASVKAEASDSSVTLVGANGASSSTRDQKPSSQTGDFHVKLSIKSFKVPEIFIEIPETATVGSLKRTVMEAVNSILGGGLRVGVLQQGKKVRDDNKTLLQTGISRGDKVDSLGFSLEPIPTQAPIPLDKSREDPHFVIPCADVEPLMRIPPAAATSNRGPSSAKMEPPSIPIVKSPESDHDSVHSPDTAPLQEKPTADSKALVPVSAMEVEALAVVPPRKPKRSELVQRRIRRPFSVSEVEALVQAVEKLGTGRWRDVKLRAFDNAKHRTYVDLKDKWKTLVHTARISPQQRRGEPVPQVLLDRVLSAHAYWSQQQAKLQVKPPPPKACMPPPLIQHHPHPPPCSSKQTSSNLYKASQ